MLGIGHKTDVGPNFRELLDRGRQYYDKDILLLKASRDDHITIGTQCQSLCQRCQRMRTLHFRLLFDL